MRFGLGIVAALLMAGSAAAQAAPVSFAKMVVRIPAGTPWAQVQYDNFPLPCANSKTLTWESTDNEVVKDPEFERTFRSELLKGGFAVAGDPNNLFEEDQKSSDLQVGALVNAIEAKFCATQSFKDALLENDRVLFKGSVKMKVEWQVYSTSQARVVARVPTEGEHLLVKAVDGGNHVLLQGAFAQNVQKLVASESFRNALSGPTAASIPPPGAALAALRVAYRPAAAPVAFDQAARGVVSIFAGQGMGSGVLISADGYILTNHHVAGEAGRVRVRWADGTDTPGEVVRADRGRDVALIKTTAKTAPLGIRTAPVKLGETVYAIGTPKERDFAGTLTRGVVSSPKRVLDGRSYIQSDVAITNGNSGGALIDEKGGLVGLSVAGYAPGGVPLGINFFIPIEEALQSLALTPAG